MSNANLNIKLPAAAERLIQAGHVRGLGFEYDNASARAYALMLRFGMVYDALEQEVEGLFTGEHFAELQAALETDGNTTPWLNGDLAPVFPDPFYSQRNAEPLMGERRAWAA